MKKKILAVFLSLCMAMSLLPVTALAAEGEGKISPPTASDNNFFANGTPITITKEIPAGGEKATVEGFTAEGEDAYISWYDNETTKYVGVSDDVSIYGGGDGRAKSVTLPSTSITMTGGTVWNLFGGNYGEETKDKNFCSTVEGNVNISLSGKAVVKNLLHGAGARNTCVNGTITMTFDGVDLSNDTNKLYVNGGSWGNGNEGTRKIESGAMDTNAVANKVVINATNSKFYLLGGGGSGSTKVKDADVNLTKCEVDLLYLSGINGEVMDSSIVATDCKIGSFSATNCGFVGTGSVDLNNCTVTKLNTGAAEGCFSSDSGGTDGSGVTGRVSYDIDADSIVKEAVLTPHVMRLNNNYTSTIQNVTINKEGASLELSVASFDAVYKDGSATIVLEEYLVPEDSFLTLNNVETTIAKDNTLTNAGTINMDKDSSLTVASGATLKQAGTVNGEVENNGTITKYVARVGNKGYESLEAALNAVKDNGGTITLLDNAKLEGANNYTIKGDVTIQGNYTITATPAAGQRTKVFTIENGGKLMLDGVTLNITGTQNAEDGKKEGDGINVRYGAELGLKDATVTFTDMFSPLVFEASPDTTTLGKLTMENSTITATGTRGNFSNGGEWAIKERSTVNIKDCGTHGLSVEKLTVDKSNVTVDGAKWVGIYASEMSFTNGANVTVTNCATAEGIGNTYKNKGAVQLKHVGSETPELKIEDSTLTLTGNGNGATTGEQTVYVGDATVTIDADSNVYAQIESTDSATQYYTVVFKNENGEDQSKIVASTSEPISLPDLPDQGYNHFVGWTDGTTTYDANTQVKIEKDTTFTAVWTYIPPANPNYRIDIPAAEGGTVTADPAAAKAGATVTLTATPDEGYAVGTITVTDRFGDAVKVTENADGTYTFTMPNGQVTVKATFVETEEPAPAEPFPDVDENDWFYDEVVYVYENGLMNGVENNQFAPNTATNRAMLATILYRLAGQPDVSGDLPFTDVAAGTWYTDAVLWAAQNGIVNGLGENTFAPMNTLTREQLVTMLYRYAEAEGYDVSAAADLSGYPDADKVQTYAQEAMSWAVAEGIVAGMEDGTLNPAGNATRAQIATILMRFCEGVAK